VVNKMSPISDRTSNALEPESPDHTVQTRGQSPVVLYVDVYPYWMDPATGAPRFLALHRREDVQLADTWQPVCGKIKTGETISGAFFRQVADKTGQSPSRMWSLTTLNSFYDGHYDAVLIVPAAACELQSLEVKVDIKYHRAFQWLSADSVKRHFIWESQRRCVEEIQEGIAEGLDRTHYRFRGLRRR
jgi:ADP-ribose pyrophosphatase YjhB (NUDIX family)